MFRVQCQHRPHIQQIGVVAKCVESVTDLPLFPFLFLRSDGAIAVVFHVVSIVSVYAETVFCTLYDTRTFSTTEAAKSRSILFSKCHAAIFFFI